MKIFFVGSVVNNDYNTAPEVKKEKIQENLELWEAAACLGKEATKRGHTIMVGSERLTTIDYYVVHNGLIPIAEINPDNNYFLEIYRPDDKKRPFASVKNPNIKNDLYTRHLLEKSDDIWLIAHHSAVLNADVIIAIGGGQGTERTVLLADSLNIPVLPISFFGGGAEDAYKKIRSKLDARNVNVSILNAQWDNSNGMEIINIAEKIGRHSYFLSHSHEELAWCDLVHLALVQKFRNVLRDKDLLIAGHKVQEYLEEAIQKSETFILLWSDASSKSIWCRKELEVALEHNKKGFSPRRIVLLLKDDTPLPKEVSEYFQLKVTSREENFRAIETIVKQEIQVKF